MAKNGDVTNTERRKRINVKEVKDTTKRFQECSEKKCSKEGRALSDALTSPKRADEDAIRMHKLGVRWEEVYFLLTEIDDLSERKRKSLEKEKRSLEEALQKAYDAHAAKSILPKRKAFDECQVRHCSEEMVDKFAAMLSRYESQWVDAIPACNDHVLRFREMLRTARREGMNVSAMKDIDSKRTSVIRCLLQQSDAPTFVPNEGANGGTERRRVQKSFLERLEEMRNELSVVARKHPPCRKIFYANRLDEDGERARIYEQYNQAIDEEKDGAKLNDLVARRDEEIAALPSEKKMIACALRREDFSRKFEEMTRFTHRFVKRIHEILRSHEQKPTVRPVVDVSRVLNHANILAGTFRHGLPLETKIRLHGDHRRLQADIDSLVDTLWRNELEVP